MPGSEPDPPPKGAKDADAPPRTDGHSSPGDVDLEWLRMRLGYVPGPGDLSLHERVARSRARSPDELAALAPGLPAEWDWRQVNGIGYVSTPKDQAECKSCTAFGVTGATEARAQIELGCGAQGPLRVNLSEAQLFYCTGHTCDAGWWNSAALDVLATDGVTDEHFFPYRPDNPPCVLQPGWQGAVTQIAGSRRTTQVATMKEWIVRSGPLVTAMVVYPDFEAYAGGVYKHAGGDQQGAHSVTVIGYSNPLGAWVCKNSWGTVWGEDGFFYIAYGDCGIDADMEAPNGFVRVFGEFTAVGQPALLAAGTRFHVTVRAEEGALVDRLYDPAVGWSTELLPLGGEGLPAAAGDAASAMYDGRQRVVYRAGDGEVWMADRDAGWGFRKLNLGGVTDAPAAAGDPAMLEFFGLHVVYAGAGGELWHLWHETAWNAEKLNLGGRTDAPAVAGRAVLLNYRKELHVTYRTQDGVLWDVWHQHRWLAQQLNLGGRTAAPAADSVPAVCVFDDQQHVTYITANGEVWDVWFDGSWHQQLLNLNGRTQAPAGIGDPTACAYGGDMYAIWRTEFGVLFAAIFDGGWSCQKLNADGETQAPRAVGYPVAAVYDGQLHVTYLDEAEELWDVYYAGGWMSQRLTVAPRIAPPAAIPDPVHLPAMVLPAQPEPATG